MTRFLFHSEQIGDSGGRAQYRTNHQQHIDELFDCIHPVYRPVTDDEGVCFKCRQCSEHNIEFQSTHRPCLCFLCSI